MATRASEDLSVGIKLLMLLFGQLSNHDSLRDLMTIIESSKSGQRPRRVGYLKMKVIDDLRSETISEQVKTLAGNATEIDTDDSTSYVDLNTMLK